MQTNDPRQVVEKIHSLLSKAKVGEKTDARFEDFEFKAEIGSIFKAGVDTPSISADMQKRLAGLKWMKPASICLKGEFVGFFEVERNNGAT
jgi:hypothetical protein